MNGGMGGTLFAKAFAFGFVLAAAVGPMWVLCLRRTLAQGVRAGIVSGMGVAAGDGVYAALAAFGVSAVSDVLLAQRFSIALGGSLLLAWLGARTLVARPASLDAATGDAAHRVGLARQFASTFVLTLANPPTIIAFAAVFASVGLAVGSDHVVAALLVAGVALGSALWWTILALGAAWLRARIGARFLRAVNIASGLLLLGFALWQVVHL
jgi:threonine/homoserine/homoserine lactone efflux protein